MKKNNFALFAVIHAFATLGYIMIVATLMSKIGDGNLSKAVPEPLLATAFLLLFVLSAAVVGSLIFVRPVLLYIDGHKKDAVLFLLTTIATLALILLIGLGVLILL